MSQFTEMLFMARQHRILGKIVRRYEKSLHEMVDIYNSRNRASQTEHLESVHELIRLELQNLKNEANLREKKRKPMGFYKLMKFNCTGRRYKFQNYQEMAIILRRLIQLANDNGKEDADAEPEELA